MVKHVLVRSSVTLPVSTVSTLVEKADKRNSQCNLLRQYVRHKWVIAEEKFQKKIEIVVIRGR
jgi:hypothetical protein